VFERLLVSCLAVEPMWPPRPPRTQAASALATIPHLRTGDGSISPSCAMTSWARARQGAEPSTWLDTPAFPTPKPSRPCPRAGGDLRSVVRRPTPGPHGASACAITRSTFPCSLPAELPARSSSPSPTAPVANACPRHAPPDLLPRIRFLRARAATPVRDRLGPPTYQLLPTWFYGPAKSNQLRARGRW